MRTGSVTFLQLLTPSASMEDSPPALWYRLRALLFDLAPIPSSSEISLKQRERVWIFYDWLMRKGCIWMERHGMD